MVKMQQILLKQMLFMAGMAAIIGLKGCIFFMGDAQKEENVSLKTGMDLRQYLKEICTRA